MPKCSRTLTNDNWHFFKCDRDAEWVEERTKQVYCSKHKPRGKWRGPITRLVRGGGK